jgi:hypothetical protein
MQARRQCGRTPLSDEWRLISNGSGRLSDNWSESFGSPYGPICLRRVVVCLGNQLAVVPHGILQLKLTEYVSREGKYIGMFFLVVGAGFFVKAALDVTKWPML